MRPLVQHGKALSSVIRMTSTTPVLLLFLATTSASSKQPVFSSAARDALYKGILSLTLRLANHHAETSSSATEERNLLFSPLSLALSFAVILEGAVGRTIDDILGTLHWELLRDADVRYVMAHSLLQLSKVPQLEVEGGVFVQRDLGVSQAYREALQEYYGVDVLFVNFLDTKAALVAINAWACRMTSRALQKLLQDRTTEIDTQARFLDTAVITLNVTLEKPFRVSQQKPFYITRDRPQVMETVSNSAVYGYNAFSDRGFKALELRLASSNLSLILAVPVEGSNLSAARTAFMKQPELLYEVRDRLKETEVEVTMPRFKVVAVCGLKSSLTALGYTFLFDRFEMNLATVSKHGRVYVSNVVNAVAVEIMPTSSNPEQVPATSAAAVEFRADQPFLYFVLDRSEKLPLLVGQFNGRPSAD